MNTEPLIVEVVDPLLGVDGVELPSGKAKALTLILAAESYGDIALPALRHLWPEGFDLAAAYDHISIVHEKSLARPSDDPSVWSTRDSIRESEWENACHELEMMLPNLEEA